MNNKITLNKNCFDILRYWAACCIMFLHFSDYVQLANTGTNSFFVILEIIGRWFPGVVVLFSLSGFLISSSFEKSKSPKEFFLKRVFRLYPELWACTLVNAAVLLTIAHKYLDKGFIVWLFTQIFGIAYTPSCLKSFSTGSVNGALWTIFTELQLYIVLGITYKFIKKLSGRGWLLFLSALTAVNIFGYYVYGLFGPRADKLMSRTFIPYALWFFIGVFCYLKREKIVPILKKNIILLLSIDALIKVIDYFSDSIVIPGYYASIATGILCPLIVIGLAYSLPPVRIKTDLTYGIFLYHWIVLNVIYYFGLIQNLNLFLCTAIYISATLILAYLSHRFISVPSKNLIKRF